MRSVLFFCIWRGRVRWGEEGCAVCEGKMYLFGEHLAWVYLEGGRHWVGRRVGAF